MSESAQVSNAPSDAPQVPPPSRLNGLAWWFILLFGSVGIFLNVNQLIDAGCWDDGDELADAYANRKCFAYGASGVATAQPELLSDILSSVDVAYQNLESVELGVTTIDHYFDTLGGISKAVARAKGSEAPVLIGDQTRGDGVVRTLNEQLQLETRTRTKYERVRTIVKHNTNGVRRRPNPCKTKYEWGTKEAEPLVKTGHERGRTLVKHSIRTEPEGNANKYEPCKRRYERNTNEYEPSKLKLSVHSYKKRQHDAKDGNKLYNQAWVEKPILKPCVRFWH